MKFQPPVELPIIERTNGVWNPFPQPASAWKRDDDEFVADRKRYKAMGGRFREPVLVTPAILAHLDAILAARRLPKGFSL